MLVRMHSSPVCAALCCAVLCNGRCGPPARHRRMWACSTGRSLHNNYTATTWQLLHIRRWCRVNTDGASSRGRGRLLQGSACIDGAKQGWPRVRAATADDRIEHSECIVSATGACMCL